MYGFLTGARLSAPFQILPLLILNFFATILLYSVLRLNNARIGWLNEPIFRMLFLGLFWLFPITIVLYIGLHFLRRMINTSRRDEAKTFSVAFFDHLPMRGKRDISSVIESFGHWDMHEDVDVNALLSVYESLGYVAIDLEGDALEMTDAGRDLALCIEQHRKNVRTGKISGWGISYDADPRIRQMAEASAIAARDATT